MRSRASGFGEALVVIAGVEQKAHFLAVNFPHSDACFVKAYPAETTEAFCDGHNAAFAFFGVVPLSSSMTIRRLPWRILETANAFVPVFSANFNRIISLPIVLAAGQRQRQGKVEGLVGYARRNFMVPIPHFASYAAFKNIGILLRKRQDERLRGHAETIGERLKNDLAAMLPLPATPYDACAKQATRVSSLSLVRYRNNDYSVPVAYGHRRCWSKLCRPRRDPCGSDCIAKHARSYDKAILSSIRCIIWR